MSVQRLSEVEQLAGLPENVKNAFIAYYAALYAYRRKYPN